MKHLIFILLSFIFGMAAVHAQNVTSSPLPIVLINVDGNATIPDDYKVPGTMKILYVDDSTTNYVSNQNNPAYIHYEGRVGIEKRGSTSQNLNKRHYGFETRQADDVTNANVSLLGMPEENDWILNPLNYDNTYLLDPLSYALANRTGHYAPRTKYCEVFVGGNYRGIYFLTEKIKADKNRVNIHKIDSSDNAQPQLSGGFIIKADKTTGGDPVAWTDDAHDYWEDVNYIHHFPKPADVTPAQSAYIHSYFDSLQSAMDRSDNSITTGYPSLIDVPSFVDYMIIGELSSNVDIYQKSTFFYKDRQSKLCAGPVWDFNAAYGSDPFASPGRSGYNVWQFDNGDNTGSEFWYQLFHDPQYHRLFCRRWHELTAPGAPLAYDSVVAIIDSLDDVIVSLVSRDNQRWGYFFSHTSAVNSLKNWLQNRYNWLNAQLTDTVNSLPPVPALAFSKIHYHPKRYGIYPADSLEFIGITNLSDTVQSLAGLYLSQLGLSYQFPPDAMIDTAQEIYLAADTAAFRARYGVEAMGQFARSLSNSSQRLVLSDAWGRTVDDVTYHDRGAWPAEADGDGPFLTLIDLYADNNVGSNWATDTTLIHLPVCVTPTHLLASNIGKTSATLTWSADSAQHLWQLTYWDGGISHTVLSADSTLVLTDLAPGNTYQVAVSSLCSSDIESDYSDTLEFSTIGCYSVSNVYVDVVGQSATASWLDPQVAGTWMVSYVASGGNPYQGTMQRVHDATVTFANLMPGVYDFYVLALCENTFYSDWSQPITFEIQQSEEPTDIAPTTSLAASLYPNPTSDIATLHLPDIQGQAIVTVLDVYGRPIRRYATSESTLTLSGLASGVYWVNVASGSHRITTKLIVQ